MNLRDISRTEQAEARFCESMEKLDRDHRAFLIRHRRRERILDAAMLCLIGSGVLLMAAAIWRVLTK